eukprot:8572857-Pyramimonas_sp.AAC.2
MGTGPGYQAERRDSRDVFSLNRTTPLLPSVTPARSRSLHARIVPGHAEGRRIGLSFPSERRPLPPSRVCLLTRSSPPPFFGVFGAAVHQVLPAPRRPHLPHRVLDLADGASGNPAHTRNDGDESKGTPKTDEANLCGRS